MYSLACAILPDSMGMHTFGIGGSGCATKALKCMIISKRKVKKMKKSFKSKVLSCAMILVICLSMSTGALAYQSVTWHGYDQTVNIQLNGSKIIKNEVATCHLVGSVANHGFKQHDYTGVTGAYYYGTCNRIEKHDKFSATKGMVGTGLNVTSNVTGGTWNRIDSRNGEYVWKSTAGSIAKYLTYSITFGQIGSLTATCYTKVFYSGGSSTVWAGDWHS